MQDIQLQAIIAFLFPVVLQLAKRSQSKALAWIDQNRPRVAVVVSGLAALCTNAGLSFAHTAHSITISWADLPTAIHGLVTFATMAGVQLGAQHVSYNALWKYLLPSPPNQPHTPALADVAVAGE